MSAENVKKVHESFSLSYSNLMSEYVSKIGAYADANLLNFLINGFFNTIVDNIKTILY
jgi:hypothetical protein